MLGYVLCCISFILIFHLIFHYFCYYISCVTKRLNILCIIMVKIIAFLIIMLSTLLYARVGNLLTCRKHLYDLIIPLSREDWTCNYSLTPSLFNEVPVSD